MEWAKKIKRSGKCPLIEVDADKAYPEMLKELKVEKIDQYWLEVAFQCIKMDCQMAYGFGIVIHMFGSKKFAQKSYPKGRGWVVATKGKEARGHYKNLRGRLP